MSYPFGALKESSGPGWQFPRRQIRRLISSLLPGSKRTSPSPRRSSASTLRFEPLEPRLLLSADLAFAAMPDSDLTVRLDSINDIDTIVIIDNNIIDPSAQIVANQALADTTAIRITGSDGDDRLTIDQTNPFIVPIYFDDASSSDHDTLALTGVLSNIWQLTAANEGTVGNIAYTGIENLSGGSGDDTFHFSGGSVTGIIDAGDGFDTLDYSASSSAVTINLSDNTATDTAGVTGFESVIGSSLTSDLLIGTDAGDTWEITASGTGTVAGIDFSGFENLQGGSGDDTFVFSGGSVLSVAGGSGDDTLDLSADTAGVTIDLAAGTASYAGSITGIENVISGAGNDTLIGSLQAVLVDTGAGSDTLDFSTLSSDLTIGIAADGSVSVSDGVDSISGITGIENIVGSSGTNTYVLADGASLSGALSGTSLILDYSAYTTSVAVDIEAE